MISALPIDDVLSAIAAAGDGGADLPSLLAARQKHQKHYTRRR